MDSGLIEGVLHDIFNLYFFLGYDKQANWFLIRFHQDIQTKKTIKSCLRGVHDAVCMTRCAWRCGVKIFRFCEPPLFILLIFFPMKAKLPNKRILSACPFKRNQRPAIFSILTPQCADWLRGVMHTAMFLKHLNISVKIKPNLKICQFVYT